MTAKSTTELLLVALRKRWSPASFCQLETLTPAQWSMLARCARQQQVAPLLYHRLQQQGLDKIAPAPVLAQLQQAHQQTAIRNLRLYHDLNQLVRGFHEQQIPIIVLKGAYLAGAVYEQIGLRKMVDIDLLVPAESLASVIAVVTQLGYQPQTPLTEITPYLANHHHLPRLAKPGQTSVEIHWTITLPNQRYAIPIQELWQRTQPVTVAGMEVAGLSPEDLLLHICFHATYHHQLEQGIRFLCDIAAILERFADTLNWAQVTQRAHQWGWARGVYLALHLAADLLETEIPQPVLQTLQPNESPILIVQEAKQWLSSPRSALSEPISHSFSQLWQRRALTTKAWQVLQRIFLPRTVMAAHYKVPPDSAKLYLLYLVRFKELLVRYSRIFYQLRHNQPEHLLVIKRQATLPAWLEHQQ